MARIVFTMEDGTPVEVELGQDLITIGRQPGSMVVLPSASVSSHHATIRHRGDAYYVQDLGSTNGTKLNGVPVEEAKLEDGDHLTIGGIPGIVYYTDKPAGALLGGTEVEPSADIVHDPDVIAEPHIASPDVAMPRYVARPNVGPSLPNSPQSAPPPKRPAGGAVGGKHRRTVQDYKEPSGIGGFLMFLLFLALAFVAGLHLRHAVENSGKVLIVDIMQKMREGKESGDAVPGEPAKGADAEKDKATTPRADDKAQASKSAAPAKPGGDGMMEMK